MLNVFELCAPRQRRELWQLKFSQLLSAPTLSVLLLLYSYDCAGVCAFVPRVIYACVRALVCSGLTGVFRFDTRLKEKKKIQKKNTLPIWNPRI